MTPKRHFEINLSLEAYILRLINSFWSKLCAIKHKKSFSIARIFITCVQTTLFFIWYCLWLTFDKNQALNHPGQLLYSWQEELGEKWKVQFCTMAKCMKKFLKIEFLRLTFKTQLHKNAAEREIVQAGWKHSEYHIDLVPQWACWRPKGFLGVSWKKYIINLFSALPFR